MIFLMNGTIRYTIRPYDTIWMLAQVFNTTPESIMELNPGIEPRRLQIGQVITIQPGFQYYQPFPSGPEAGMGPSMEADMEFGGIQAELCKYFRMLWEQHVTWTRIAVMGIVHDLPETDLILQRLLRNPTDFADAFRPFYGDEEANAFGDLLHNHLTIAAQLVRDAKAGNTDAVTQDEKKWFENANQIADFLGSINPYWSTDDWSAMMNEHLELLRDNTLQMLAGDYEQSINGYDDIEAQALEMADMMCEGIARQFPS